MQARKSIKSFTALAAFAAATTFGLLASTGASAHPAAQGQSQQWFGPRDTIKLAPGMPYYHDVVQPYVVQPQLITGQSQFVVPDPRVVYYAAPVPYYAQPYAPYYGAQYGAYFAPYPAPQYAPYYAPPFHTHPVYATPMR